MDNTVFKAAIDGGWVVLPCNENKVPLVREWQNGLSYEQIVNVPNKHGIGVVCGSINDNLEVIDVDTKYDITGRLWDEYRDLIINCAPDLFDKLVVQGTVNGGIHLFYKCSTIEGNMKLARRKAIASEVANNEKYKVLIETRGEGGYVVTSPTEGYSFIRKKLRDIVHITPEEREILFGLAQSFDEINRDNEIKFSGKDSVIKTVVDDYNERTTAEDVLSLMEKHGWTVVRRTSHKAIVKRPGADSSHSGYFHFDNKWLVVFSSSSEFDTEKAYNPSAIYCMLEHGGVTPEHWSKAVKELSKQGYGVKMGVMIPEVRKPMDIDSKIIPWDEIDKDAEDYYEDRIQHGRGVGIYELDKYYKLRHKSMIVMVGSKGHGKTTTAIWLLTMDAWFHGSKWMVAALENEAYEIRDQIISFLLCEDAKMVYLNDRPRYLACRDFAKKHFTFLRNDGVSDGYKMLEVIKEINTLDPHSGVFIDPLNSIPKPRDLFNEYTHHTNFAAFLQTFCKKNLTVFLTVHPNSSTQRGGGQPKDVDAEFGGVYPNKADMTFSAWRDVKGDVRNIIKFSIDKVRNKKIMGGDETPFDRPIEFCFNFVGYGYDIKVPEDFGGYRDFPNPLIHSMKYFSGEIVEDVADVVEDDYFSDVVDDVPF